MKRNYETFVLLSNGAANSDPITWPGGEGQVDVILTLGTVTLEILAGDGATWVAVDTTTTFTANGVATFNLGKGVKVRLGVVTSTAVYGRLHTI